MGSHGQQSGRLGMRQLALDGARQRLPGIDPMYGLFWTDCWRFDTPDGAGISESRNDTARAIIHRHARYGARNL
eukprot:scaffold463129_cov52-Prasinocladus_malaysianus.AAC.1